VTAGTFVDILRARADSQRDHIAFSFLPDGGTDRLTVTYGDLDRQARTIAGRLQVTASPGDRALLVLPPGIEYIAAFMGCMYAGVVAVPVFPPASSGSLNQLTAVIHDCEPRLALTSGVLATRIPADRGGTRTAVVVADAGEPGGGEGWTPRPVRPEQLAYLQYTSGSTGTPRGVAVTHANLVHNSAAITARCRLGTDTPGVSWLPPYHDMGLVGSVLQPIYSGFHMALMPPMAFLRRPVRWLQAISRHRAVLTVAPNFAYELCVRDAPTADDPQLDLSSWQIAYVGAEPVRADTLDRFTTAFARYGFRRRTFVPCYGLAEATLMVSAVPRDSDPTVLSVDRWQLGGGAAAEKPGGDPSAVRLVGCGPAVHGQPVVIVDPYTGRRCPPAEVGEIWVGGPSVAQGYWNKPADTAEVFQAHLRDTGEGPFLRTGDLGVVLDGELYVTGRIKDLIIINGRNHHPSDIELTVANADPRQRHGFCVAFPVDVDGEERLVVVLEVRPTVPANGYATLVDDIRRAVSAEHGLAVHEVVLVDRGSVPKTLTGKVRRTECRAAYLNHTLRVRHRDELTGAGSTVRARLLAAAPEKRRTLLTGHCAATIARVVGMDASSLDAGRPLHSLGIDSMMAVALRNQLAADLGVTLPIMAFLAESTLDELVRTALGLMADPAAPQTPKSESAPESQGGPARLDELDDGDIDALLHRVLDGRVADD